MCCMVYVIGWALIAVCRLLIVVRSSLTVVCLFSGRCVLTVVRYLLFVVRCLQFVVC